MGDEKELVMSGGRKHPSDFVGQRVTAYPTCGPFRMRRILIVVEGYAPATGIATIRNVATDEVSGVIDNDWTVLDDVDDGDDD